jgi:hypothetical protein
MGGGYGLYIELKFKFFIKQHILLPLAQHPVDKSALGFGEGWDRGTCEK